MGKGTAHRFESAGWGAWIVASLILSVPIGYGMWTIRDTEAHPARIVLGAVTLGAIVGGIVTAALNGALQHRAARRAQAARHSKTKRKKKQ